MIYWFKVSVTLACNNWRRCRRKGGSLNSFYEVAELRSLKGQNWMYNTGVLDWWNFISIHCWGNEKEGSSMRYGKWGIANSRRIMIINFVRHRDDVLPLDILIFFRLFRISHISSSFDITMELRRKIIHDLCRHRQIKCQMDCNWLREQNSSYLSFTYCNFTIQLFSHICRLSCIIMN